MQLINGIWLPEGDRHFGLMMARRALQPLQGRMVGTYQLDKLQAALACCKKRRVAVDAGAHVGFWSMWLAESFGSVHAFEPLPEHVECFRCNVTQGKVTLHAAALGERTGTVAMETDPDNSGKAHAGGGGDKLAAMVALDDLGLRKVDFIKIDVEGMEPQVIAGAAATIQACRPVIVVEVKGHHERYGNTEFAALEALERMGMTQLRRLGDDYLYGWKKAKAKPA